MGLNEKNYFYVLGLLLAKGKIQVNNPKNYVDLIFEIRFNKPSSSSLRSDNVHNIKDKSGEDIYDYSLPDIIRIWDLLREIFPGTEVLLEHIPEPINEEDFSKKIVRWVVSEIPKNHPFFKYFWQNEKIINSRFLDSIPKRLIDLKNKVLNNKLSFQERILLKEFLQGISDASAIIPGPESSAFGAEGTPRIQIEVDNPRWELNIYMCLFLQKIFGVPVLNINWPHPTIKGRKNPKVVLKHNHQFRTHLWHFQNIGFKLLIKKYNFRLLINKLKKEFKKNPPVVKFHPENRKKFKYINLEKYKKIFPNVTGKTTTPYPCKEHYEDSETLPPQIRNKHYAEWRDINFDLGDPLLKEYPSNLSKNKNKDLGDFI